MDDELIPAYERVTLLELVDRVLDKGVVISGDVTLSVADVDLVYVGLRVLLSSVATLEAEARDPDAEAHAGGARETSAVSERGSLGASRLRDH